MKYIQCTLFNGGMIVINLSQIVAFRPKGDGSLIYIPHESPIQVKESPTALLDLITRA